jgi:hypothetical protein
MNIHELNLLALGVVWTFWMWLTIGAIRAKVSWFPFTLVVPLVLSVVAIAINRWPPWGTALVTAIHALLWLYVLFLWLQLRRSRRMASHECADEDRDRS